jgi:hypothetical protein
MLSSEFVRGYPSFKNDDEYLSAEQIDALSTSRFWDNRFSTIMANHLSEEVAVADPSAFQDELDDYQHWATTVLPDTEATLESLDTIEYQKYLQRQMKFHHINRNVLQLWGALLFRDELDEDTLDKMQLEVALDAVPAANAYLQLNALQDFSATSPLSQPLLETIDVLNRTDIITIGLEMIKSSSDTLLMPAPNLFALNPHKDSRGQKHAAQFIGIDTQYGHAHGLRVVRSRKKGKFENAFDSDFLTVLSGEHDLKNKVQPDVTEKAFSRPGITSMSLLASRLTFDHPSYNASIDTARELASTFESPLYAASDAVNDLLQKKLHT